VLNEFFQQFIGNVAVRNDKVPMFFTGVIAGLNAVVFFTKFNGSLGVAFEVDALFEVIEVNHCEDFIFNPKNQCTFVEGQIGSYLFTNGLTRFEKIFYVHQSYAAQGT